MKFVDTRCMNARETTERIFMKFGYTRCGDKICEADELEQYKHGQRFGTGNFYLCNETKQVDKHTAFSQPTQ